MSNRAFCSHLRCRYNISTKLQAEVSWLVILNLTTATVDNITSAVFDCKTANLAEMSSAVSDYKTATLDKMTFAVFNPKTATLLKFSMISSNINC